MSDIEQGSSNVFADLGFAEAAQHRAKAELVRKVAAVMAERKLNQSAAALIVGVSQPDISRLLSGRFRDVSITRLLTMLQRLGCQVEISVAHDGHAVGTPVDLVSEAA